MSETIQTDNGVEDKIPKSDTLKGQLQGMHQDFGSAGAVHSIKESSGPQNQRVHIVLKSLGAKGDIPKTLPEYVLAKKIRGFGIQDW